MPTQPLLNLCLCVFSRTLPGFWRRFGLCYRMTVNTGISWMCPRNIDHLMTTISNKCRRFCNLYHTVQAGLLWNDEMCGLMQKQVLAVLCLQPQPTANQAAALQRPNRLSLLCSKLPARNIRGKFRMT